MNEYFISYCFYLGLLIALLIGFGFGFHCLVKNGWDNLSSKFGMYAYLPRFIGTPIHELGHLFFAIITGSKILDVKLFPNINSRLKTSGGAYVKFSPRNGVLGSISCFLSGIGPMIFCPAVIMYLMYQLMPQLYDGIIGVLARTDILKQENLLLVIQSVICGFFGSFQVNMLKEWNFYVFLLLAIPIANECMLSKADIKNAGKGFSVLLILLLAGGFFISNFPAIAIPFITGIAKGTTFIMCVLCLGLVFNLIHWVWGILVRWLL